MNMTTCIVCNKRAVNKQSCSISLLLIGNTVSVGTEKNHIVAQIKCSYQSYKLVKTKRLLYQLYLASMLIWLSGLFGV